MPIHQIGQEKKKGTIGSPYAVRDYYSINPDYGTKDDLRRLITEAHRRGLKVIIAGAGGAAHLPGMVAAKTWVPVLGVPVHTNGLGGIDSLLSIVQMPAGVPVGTLAIGRAGAVNAALLAASIVARGRPEVLAALERYRADKKQGVLDDPDPRG